MSKPTMATLRSAAARYGAEVDDSQIMHGHINVDAPVGKVWDGEDLHALCLHWCTLDSGRPEWPEEKTEAIEDALERMSHGLTDCPFDDCDTCESNAELTA